MKNVAAATEVRNQFGKFLSRVYRERVPIVVEKGGIPVAALIGIRDYEEFRQWLAKKLHHELGRKLDAEFDRQNITEENLIGLLKDDRQSVYEHRYGKKQ